jgi:hypothetical protein
MSVRNLEERAGALVRLPGPVVRRLVESLLGLGAAGLLAIGVSGIVAYGMGTAFGKSFVAGDQAGVTYTADRCREYLEYEPHARDCAQAAVFHHYGEVVGYRLDAGILGLIALGVWWFIRRGRRTDREPLPDGFAATIGVSLTALAAALLLATGLAAIVFQHSRGAGDPLSGGIVSLALACWFARSLYGVLRARA